MFGRLRIIFGSLRVCSEDFGLSSEALRSSLEDSVWFSVCGNKPQVTYHITSWVSILCMALAHGYQPNVIKKVSWLLTGSIASAHSPCPLCSILTLSISSLIRTKSPTTNCDEDTTPDGALAPDAVLGMAAVGDVIVGEDRESTLSDVSDEPVTLVKIAGLKVHLEVKCRVECRKC